VTCGTGTKTRKLMSLSGSPFEIVQDEETKSCAKKICPWSEWSGCSVTCGRGEKTRNRLGETKVYRRSCYQPHCPQKTTEKPAITTTTWAPPKEPINPVSIPKPSGIVFIKLFLKYLNAY